MSTLRKLNLDAADHPSTPRCARRGEPRSSGRARRRRRISRRSFYRFLFHTLARLAKNRHEKMQLVESVDESLVVFVAKDWQVPDRKVSSALLKMLVFLKDLPKVVEAMEPWSHPWSRPFWHRSRR